MPDSFASAHDGSSDSPEFRASARERELLNEAAMRLVALLMCLLPTGCSESSPPVTTATDGSSEPTDAGPDGFDAPSYDSADFSSFRYFWGGTGQAGSFDLDRDCGIEAGGYLSYASPNLPNGAGVVAEADCNAFKSLAVSTEVVRELSAKSKPNSQCEMITDDYISVTVALTDKTKIEVLNALGCSDHEPFVRLRTEALRLANKYLTIPDAGTD